MPILSNLKIGFKIAILPVLAVGGLLVSFSLNYFFDQKVSYINKIIESSHESAIALTEKLYLQSSYLSNPIDSYKTEIQNKHDLISEIFLDIKKNTSQHEILTLLESIENNNNNENDLFESASSTVKQIKGHQKSLSTLFHQRESLAKEKVNEISILITYLMLEGKTLSDSKREYRNSLREFIGLTSNAMLNTVELLFSSDSKKYEIAEEKRKQELFLVTRACKALSLVTGDESDAKAWALIEQNQERIAKLRESIFDHWKERERFYDELKTLHEILQNQFRSLVSVADEEKTRLESALMDLNLISSSFIVAILIILSFLLIRHITIPIANLTLAAKAFKIGKKKSLPKIVNKDEVGILTETFREMMEARTELEEQIISSESRFRQLAENINEVFWIVTPGWSSVIYVSPAYEDVWGKSCESLKENPNSWIESIHVNDQKAVIDYINKNSGIDISEYEFPLYRICRPDGGERWIKAKGFPVRDDSGKIFRIVGIAEDITEKKEAENTLWELKNRFEKVFDSQLDAIFILTADKPPLTLDCNRAATEIFGFSKEELIGKHVDILHVDELHLKEFQRMLYPAIQASGLAKNIQFSMKRKNGVVVPTEHSVLEMKNESGERIGWISIIRDLSEKMELEAKLKQAQKMEAIGTLAGGIAHDFNNILFPIVGMAELLLEDLPKDSQEYSNANEIFIAGQRAGSLVKQILSFSRQTEHKMMPIKAQLVIKEVIKLSRSSIPVDIKIHTNIQDDCGMVEADPNQIHQIIMNLITNAYHAVESAGGEISVELFEKKCDLSELKWTSLAPGPYAIMSVSDTGTGMNPSEMEKIFEPYFTTKEQGKGTGLGLSVVFGIVREHHGDIKVKSKKGEGSVFSIYLPALPESRRYDFEGRSLKLPTGTEKILVVDDEKSIVKLEEKILSRLGYQVESKTNSYDALEAFKKNPDFYDLILSDMTMPDMTGEVLSKEILSIKPDIPIIICTGFSERINNELAEAIGVKGFLMKPVVQSDMAKMVRKVLDEFKNV